MSEPGGGSAAQPVRLDPSGEVLKRVRLVIEDGTYTLSLKAERGGHGEAEVSRERWLSFRSKGEEGIASCGLGIGEGGVDIGRLPRSSSNPLAIGIPQVDRRAES